MECMPRNFLVSFMLSHTGLPGLFCACQCPASPPPPLEVLAYFSVSYFHLHPHFHHNFLLNMLLLLLLKFCTFHLGYIYFPFPWFFLHFFCSSETIYSPCILVNIFSGFRSGRTTKDSSSFFALLG